MRAYLSDRLLEARICYDDGNRCRSIIERIVLGHASFTTTLQIAPSFLNCIPLIFPEFDYSFPCSGRYNIYCRYQRRWVSSMVRRFFKFLLKNPVGCRCSFPGIVRCTSGCKSCPPISYLTSLSGTLHDNYWCLGWLSAWLSDATKVRLGLYDVEAVCNMAIKFSRTGYCFNRNHINKEV